jgi:hypothetical protein
MKKIVYIALIFCAFTINAQEANDPNTTGFKLDDNGLEFSFDEGAYQFNINGFIQPSVTFENTDGQDAISKFNVRRTFFMLSGKAAKEKVSFMIQTDFSLSRPLMDAWIAYHPYEWLTITGGQKQTFLNNREMIYREDKLQFADRSRLSRLYSNTGREFGLFVESKFGKKIGFVPQFAVTSGDGRNSFGADSRDTDFGGLKIGGRLDVYPLGYFSENNTKYTADLQHEQKLKILIGGALSKNTGASGATGESHGDFFLYDENGKNNLPNYSQLYADVLLKYKGFSFLGEYANASASNLDKPFIDEAATQILAPQQISQFLIIGDSYTMQAGYVTKKGFSFDLRYENTKPEFENFIGSLLPDSNSYTLGFTKYFKQNNLKMQAAFTSIDYSQGSNMTVIEFVVQIGF